VALCVLQAQGIGVRDGWLESVDARAARGWKPARLFLLVKTNLDDDISLNRVGYHVVLLFNSNRPSASSPLGVGARGPGR
jgi:hypothetical protein